MEISVLGSGVMGKDIAILFSQSEAIKKINLVITNSDYSEKEKIIRQYILAISKKFKSQHDVSLYQKINITDSLEVIKKSKFIIESTLEKPEIKASVIEKANDFVTSDCIFFTNTSTLSISKLSKFYKYPEFFLGLHFFNPAMRSKIIELVYVNSIQLKVTKEPLEILKKLGRKIIIIKDFPGFIINRLLLVQINEALDLLEKNIASAEDIEFAFKAATNGLIGPIGLSDFIGNDIVLEMLENLYKDTKLEKFRPGSLIKKMVQEKRLGQKTKLGFFEY